MKLTRKVYVGTLLAAFIAVHLSIAAAGEPPEVKRIQISAPITVEADGRPIVGVVTGVKGSLTQVVHDQLSSARYLPAIRDGVAVSGRSHLSASALLTPIDGDQYTIAIDGITLGHPALRIAVPPRYPAEMARRNQSGSVELRLRISADGKAIVVQTISATHSAFEKAAMESAKTWRFRPQAIEGVRADIEVSVPILFLAKHEDPTVFQCAVDPTSPRWEKQKGCLDLIEVRFWR